RGRPDGEKSGGGERNRQKDILKGRREGGGGGGEGGGGGRERVWEVVGVDGFAAFCHIRGEMKITLGRVDAICGGHREYGLWGG
ncbi:MAG: hypothetical protein DRJ61_08155, partial [Acidobacteria bacterium]